MSNPIYKLPSGMLVEFGGADEANASRDQVTRGRGKESSFTELADNLFEIIGGMASASEKMAVKPEELQIQMNVGLTASGNILISSGKMSAGLKVTLIWNGVKG